MNTKIIAHRGASAIAPENTLVALNKAIMMGVDAVEIDVHSNYENEWIVMHDERIDRTTNGTGYVYKRSLKDIKQFDAGSWKGAAFKGEKIPSLREVIELVKDRCELFIEIKTVFKPSALIAFSEMLDHYDIKSTTVIQSFNTKVLKGLHDIDNELRLQKLALGEFQTLPLYYDTCPRWGELGAIDFIEGVNVNYEFANQGFINRMQAKGLVVNAWTVNDREHMNHLLALKIDGIITDHPDKLKMVMYERENSLQVSS